MKGVLKVWDMSRVYLISICITLAVIIFNYKLVAAQGQTWKLKYKWRHTEAIFLYDKLDYKILFEKCLKRIKKITDIVFQQENQYSNFKPAKWLCS